MLITWHQLILEQLPLQVIILIMLVLVLSMQVEIQLFVQNFN